MQIKTNWQRRPMQCLQDLPASAAKDFDYVDDDCSARFVQYKGIWHDVYDTQRIEPDQGSQHPIGWAMRVHPGSPLCLFDSIESDSYFSGTLFKLVDDDCVIVARYFT